MATKFKDYYDVGCAELLGDKLAAAGTFDREGFVDEVTRALTAAGDPAFTARQDIFAEALERFLPDDYAAAIAHLTRILGPPLESAEGMFTHGWWLWPVGRYVQRNALVDTDASLPFIYQLTRRFTGEFAIRPILENEPAKTLAVLEEWSRDDDVHVRRLASEGMRIRLPWAKKLTVALDHFEAFSSVLDNLRSDGERFVQKSVGNNVNDLMKEDPDRAYAIIARWEEAIAEIDGASAKATRWIIRHGTRSARRDHARRG